MTQHLDLRGSSYVSTPDVNLLDADDAHTYQSAGAWNGIYQCNEGSVQSDSARFGGTALSFDVTGADRCDINLASNPASASSSTQFTGSVWVKYPRSVTARVDLYGDVGGRFVIGSNVSVPADTWTQITSTGTSGASDSSVYLYVRFDGVGVITSGDEGFLTDACLREGSDATFVPSLRIVGDLDVRAKIAADDWTPASNEWMFGQYGGSTARRSWSLVNRIGDIRVNTRTGGADANVTFTPTLVNGQAHEFVATRIAATGSIGLSVDGVAETPVTAASGALDPVTVAQVCEVGSGGLNTPGSNPLAGKVYWAEVRDGIDGPIVARFDASTLTEADVEAGEVTQ